MSRKFTYGAASVAYYGNRYYSPSLGRFSNRDPIEEQGGINLYGFCGNDGVNGYDYLGMDPVDDMRNAHSAEYWAEYNAKQQAASRAMQSLHSQGNPLAGNIADSMMWGGFGWDTPWRGGNFTIDENGDFVDYTPPIETGGSHGIVDHLFGYHIEWGADGPTRGTVGINNWTASKGDQQVGSGTLVWSDYGPEGPGFYAPSDLDPKGAVDPNNVGQDTSVNMGKIPNNTGSTVIIVTPGGNALPVPAGGAWGGTNDGKWIEVKNPDGTKGPRIDDGHTPKGPNDPHNDPRGPIQWGQAENSGVKELDERNQR